MSELKHETEKTEKGNESKGFAKGYIDMEFFAVGFGKEWGNSRRMTKLKNLGAFRPELVQKHGYTTAEGMYVYGDVAGCPYVFSPEPGLFYFCRLNLFGPHANINTASKVAVCSCCSKKC